MLANLICIQIYHFWSTGLLGDWWWHRFWNWLRWCELLGRKLSSSSHSCFGTYKPHKMFQWKVFWTWTKFLKLSLSLGKCLFGTKNIAVMSYTESNNSHTDWPWSEQKKPWRHRMHAAWAALREVFPPDETCLDLFGLGAAFDAGFSDVCFPVVHLHGLYAATRPKNQKHESKRDEAKNSHICTTLHSEHIIADSIKRCAYLISHTSAVTGTL